MKARCLDCGDQVDADEETVRVGLNGPECECQFPLSACPYIESDDMQDVAKRL